MCEHCSHSGDVDTADKQSCVDCKNKQTKTDTEKDSSRAKAPAGMSTPRGRTGSLSSAEVSAGSTSGSTQQSGAPATEATEASVSDKKSKNEKKNNTTKYCTSSCKASNTNNMIKCCLCSTWYHMKCLKLGENDIGGAWNCPECGRMPSDVKVIDSKIDTLTELVRSLIQTRNEDRETYRQNFVKLEEENALLQRQNEALCREVNELKRRLNEHQQKSESHEKTLILGSSLIRNLDEKKLNNTEIRCLRGAKVKDLSKELQYASSAGKKYSRIIFLGGGNDAAQKPEDIDLESVIECYKSMINTAKDMCQDISIAAIPPRLQPAHAMEHITSLNANLVALANEMDISFMDNSEHFLLHNKEVNDGYLYDQVHLNIKGSNKLAQSMGLKGNSNNTLDISSIHATQTQPSTWTNKSPKYVASGLREQSVSSPLSHSYHGYERARHGRLAPTSTKETPGPTRGAPAAQARRTEENERGVAQKEEHDFDSPFWNKARTKANKFSGNNRRKQHSYAQVTSSANSTLVNFCLYCGEENHCTNECRHGRKIECFKCNRQGHKGKFCHMYSG